MGTLAENSVTVRQGDGAMQRLAKSNVLVVGAGGLGIEIGTVSLSFRFFLHSSPTTPNTTIQPPITTAACTAVTRLTECLDAAAKNIVLAGPKSLTIVDHRATEIPDLGTQFFLTADNVGENRAIASGPKLAELNP